jgi:hypothetical protein
MSHHQFEMITCYTFWYNESRTKPPKRHLVQNPLNVSGCFEKDGLNLTLALTLIPILNLDVGHYCPCGFPGSFFVVQDNTLSMWWWRETFQDTMEYGDVLLFWVTEPHAGYKWNLFYGALMAHLNMDTEQLYERISDHSEGSIHIPRFSFSQCWIVAFALRWQIWSIVHCLRWYL